MNRSSGSSARAGVGDRVGDVLRRVARRLENGEPQLANVERLAVADRPVLVGELRTRPDDVRRAGQGGELAPARDVVVVEVRLDDVADPKVVLARRIEIDVDVAPRIDDRGEPRRLIGDQGREVPEPFDAVAGDLHARSVHCTHGRRPGGVGRDRLFRGLAPVPLAPARQDHRSLWRNCRIIARGDRAQDEIGDIGPTWQERPSLEPAGTSVDGGETGERDIRHERCGCCSDRAE